MPWHGLDALQGTRAKPGNHLVIYKTDKSPYNFSRLSEFMFPKDFSVAQHQQIGRQQNRPNTLVSAASVRYNSRQYNYNTIQYNTIQYNTIQYNTIQYNAMQCNAMQCNAIQYNTIQCNAMQCNAMGGMEGGREGGSASEGREG